MNPNTPDPTCSQWRSSSCVASAQPSSTSMGYSVQSPYVGNHNQWHTSPMLSSTASDDFEYDEFYYEQHQLTPDCRPVPPSPALSHYTPPQLAISLPADYNNNSTKHRDVRSVSHAVSFRPPSPAPRFTGYANSLERSPLSASPAAQHVEIVNDNTRLRASTPYHGLPLNLPAPPRPVAHHSTPSHQPSHTFLNTDCSNYLTMLANPSTDTTSAAASPEWHFESTTPLCGDDEPVMKYVDDSYVGDQGQYLTSPHEDNATSPMDTPLSSFLDTPGSTLTSLPGESPLIADHNGYNEDLPSLFDTSYEYDAATGVAPKLPPTDTLYAFSPTTPAHDSFEPSSPESRHGPVIPPPPTHRQRRSAHTGTRKNLRTHGLIPLDAPTQKRTYVTPSATSRKAVPATILKKRMRSIAAHGEHVDKEELEALSPTASEEEVINSKRKKNTLAARETRKRKREHLEALQEKLQALDGEVTMWRERALIGQEMLRSNGLDFSFDGQ